MIEILGVLAIAGIISVAGLAAYNTAMYRNKMNVIKEQISAIAANIKTSTAYLQNYNDLCNEQAVALGLIPDHMLQEREDGSPVIANSFGGKIIILPTNSEAEEECDKTEEKPCDSFVIKVTNLPKKPTLELSMFSWVDLEMFKLTVENPEEDDEIDKNNGEEISEDENNNENITEDNNE